LTLSIGNCVLGKQPRVALVVRDDVTRKDVEPYFVSGVDLLEMRIDQFGSCATDHVCMHLQEFAGLPCIGTIRSDREGGVWSAGEEKRLALYEKIIPCVDAIDIEISANEINSAVIQQAKKTGITVIGSFHDFQRTPDIGTLESIIGKGNELGADIIKIAAQCNTAEDLCVLTHFLVANVQMPLIILGMGVKGAPSRIFFPFLGSLLTYTFLGAPSAPGQFNCVDTVHFIKRFSSKENS